MKAKQTLIAILAISATTAMASDQKDFVVMITINTCLTLKRKSNIGLCQSFKSV